MCVVSNVGDDKTGQPNCEMEDKIKTLKIIAEAFGVGLEDIFK